MSTCTHLEGDLEGIMAVAALSRDSTGKGATASVGAPIFSLSLTR